MGNGGGVPLRRLPSSGASGGALPWVGRALGANQAAVTAPASPVAFGLGPFVQDAASRGGGGGFPRRPSLGAAGAVSSSFPGFASGHPPLSGGAAGHPGMAGSTVSPAARSLDGRGLRERRIRPEMVRLPPCFRDS